MLTLLRSGLLSGLLPLLAAQQTSSANANLCEAPGPIWEQVLDATTRIRHEQNGRYVSPEDVAAERRRRIAAVLQKYPDNFFVRRAYLTHTKEGVASEGLIAEFRSYAEAHPGDVGAQHLFAEALTGRRTPEAIKILDGVVAKDPAFPWPYRQLVAIYQSPRFSDRAKLQRNTEAFIERCPDTRIAASMAASLSADKLGPYTKRLRAYLSGKKDEDSVSSYYHLWRLEFKATPAPEHQAVRQRVAEDIKYLEQLQGADAPYVRSVLAEGYKLTEDKAAQQKMTAVAKTDGDRLNAYFAAHEEWTKTNPFVPPTAGEEERRAFQRKYAKMLTGWVEKLPKEQFLAQQRLEAWGEVPEVSDADVVAEGKRALKLSREEVQTVFGPFPTALAVARVWVKRGVELDAVPGLIEEARAAAAKRDQRDAAYDQSDLYTAPSDVLRKETNLWFRNVEIWETLTTAYYKSGKSELARQTLATWESGLAGQRRRAGEIRAAREKEAQGAKASATAVDQSRMLEDGVLKGLPGDESRYLNNLAGLAAHEKRHMDAIALYQSSIRALASSSQAPADLAKSEPGRKARELWKQAGGTTEGWQVWMESAKAMPSAAKLPDASKWSAMRKVLPELSATDRSGATWTLAKVKGKTTLINVWATWCGPCRMELPHLQKLHDQVKAREDVQVITLNVDDNIGLVEPYMKENKFTFPVIFANDYVNALVSPLLVPTNWIADRQGELRMESLGFGGDGEGWLAGSLAELENVRKQSTAR